MALFPLHSFISILMKMPLTVRGNRLPFSLYIEGFFPGSHLKMRIGITAGPIPRAWQNSHTLNLT